uniref:Uncharacterized protein n=1 Tax=Moniliophthora roreri TaxID=221103 RepID=A0A0W0F7W3_MONRR
MSNGTDSGSYAPLNFDGSSPRSPVHDARKDWFKTSQLGRVAQADFRAVQYAVTAEIHAAKLAAVDQAISVPRAVPARLAAALTNTLTAKLAIVVHLVTSAVMTSLADVVHLVPHALETENVVPAVEGVVAEAVPAQKVAQMENIAYQIKTVAEMDALIPMPSVVRPINVSMEDNAVVQDVITQPLNNAAMEGGVPNRRYVGNGSPPPLTTDTPDRPPPITTSSDDTTSSLPRPPVTTISDDSTSSPPRPPVTTTSTPGLFEPGTTTSTRRTITTSSSTGSPTSANSNSNSGHSISPRSPSIVIPIILLLASL